MPFTHFFQHSFSSKKLNSLGALDVQILMNIYKYEWNFKSVTFTLSLSDLLNLISK